VKVGNRSIKKVDQIKYLGMIFDEKLTWKPHIQHIWYSLCFSLWHC